MHRSRSNIKTNQNLELTLGLESPPKERMLARNCRRSIPNLITIDDDDDDVQIYPQNQRSPSLTMGLFPISSSRMTVTEEDLELRLGRKEHNVPAMNLGRTVNGLAEPQQAWNSVKAKHGVASSSRQRPTELQEIKLRCSICMDTMKEETSTVCGHVFCKCCISNAIVAQRRCPTCRKELSLSGIHRIYLPGALS